MSKLLAPSEWKIFALLTRHNPLSTSEITQELNRQNDPRHAVTDGTVRSLVKRILDKGYLTTIANDQRSAIVYSPSVPFETALRLHVNNFLDQYAPLGAPDLRLIRDLVDRRLTAADPVTPLLERIEVEPRRALVRGTSVTVDRLLECLASGSSPEDILADHPELSREDVLAAVAFARAALLSSTLPETGH